MSFRSIRLASVWLALLLLAGCGPAPAPVETLDFWAMGREGEVVQALLPEFERRNPGIRVRVQQIPWSAAHEKLLTAYAGDSMPDLFQLGNTWIPEMAALKAVEPLEGRVRASDRVSEDDYFPGILDTNRIDATLAALPWYVDTRVLFYRTDLLEAAGYREPPGDWAAWEELLGRLTDPAARRHGILLPVNEWTVPAILALQAGSPLLAAEGRHGAFGEDAFRRAFDFYLGLFEKGLAPPVGAGQVANLYQDFAAGRFAMYITGPWNIGEFTTRLPADLQGRWATAPLPAPDGNSPGLSLAGGASLAISRTSPRKEAAWRLVEYLSEPAQQLTFYRLSGDLPARKAAWRDGGLTEDPRARAFWTQLQRVVPTPKVPEWEHIAEKIGHYAEATVRGLMTRDQALAALDRDVDRILEKRRWLLERGRGP